MARNAWAFLRNFSATKYYQAAQSGVLTGSGVHSFGAVFMTNQFISALQTIFGNAVFGTDGDGIRVDASGRLEGACGTLQQITGTALAAADATYALTPEGDAINAWRASVNENVVASEGGALSPRPMNLIHAAVTVNPAGNQRLYVNGRTVASATDALVASAAPYRIGVDAAAANPASAIYLAGCWYTNTELSDDDVFRVFAASANAKQIRGPNDLGGAADLAYIWDVKTGNFDARDSWASRGAETPIAMVKQGATAFAVADRLSLDVGFQTV